MGKPWTHIAGTENTGEYLAVAHVGDRSNKLGVRFLASGAVRIRVEPRNTESAEAMSEVLTRDEGWKQPGDAGQKRFSTVAFSPDSALEAVDTALKALKTQGKAEYNSDRGKYRKRIREHTASSSLF